MCLADISLITPQPTKTKPVGVPTIHNLLSAGFLRSIPAPHRGAPKALPARWSAADTALIPSGFTDFHHRSRPLYRLFHMYISDICPDFQGFSRLTVLFTRETIRFMGSISGLIEPLAIIRTLPLSAFRLGTEGSRLPATFGDRKRPRATSENLPPVSNGADLGRAPLFTTDILNN